MLGNVRLLTSCEPRDVAVVDGRVSEAAPPGTERLDCQGRWLIPGLWDQHVHMTQWAINNRRLDVSSAHSAAEAAALCAGVAPTEEPLVAAYAHMALWPDEPTGALLDETCHGRPVVVIAFDLHSAWASTSALAHYGMSSLSAGLVREEDCFELQRRMTDLPVETTDAWVTEAAADAAAKGIVGIRDLEMNWNIDPWRRRMAAGFDTLRVRASVYPSWLDQALALGIRTGEVDPDFELLAVGPFKLISDGSLNTKTASCHDPFPGGSCGALNFTVEELHESMSRAHAGGLHCAIHAIGDRANTVVLDAFEATGARGTIEHAQLLSDDDVPRFAALGVGASVQPQHCVDDRDAGDQLWSGRTQRMYRFADLHTAGAQLLLGSDAPVAPLDPWAAIQAAADRCLPGEQSWHPEQRLSSEVALACSTDGHGIAPRVGDVADLVLLDDDPLTCDSETLRHMPVAATLLGGRFTHRAL